MSFSKFFSQQARQPSGWFGRWVMPAIFTVGNARLNRLVYENLSPRSGDRILEIGSGAGQLLHKIAESGDGFVVEGVDVSHTMVSVARRKNKRSIAEGKAVIHKGYFDDIPFPPGAFTKICSVNTIYFWPNPEFTLEKMGRLLNPGGMLVLGFEDSAQLEHRPLDTGIFRFFKKPEVERLLIDAGFTPGNATRSICIGKSVFHCVVAIH